MAQSRDNTVREGLLAYLIPRFIDDLTQGHSKVKQLNITLIDSLLVKLAWKLLNRGARHGQSSKRGYTGLPDYCVTLFKVI